jgi:hypothetical protein
MGGSNTLVKMASPNARLHVTWCEIEQGSKCDLVEPIDLVAG